MNKVTGTPRTLTQCLKNALNTETVPKLEDVHEHVKDYLSQRFTVAILKSDDERAAELKKLFEEIVR